MIAAIKKFFKSLYQEFLSIHGSPHNVALAFAMGFFLGILPFTGVVAAIAVAWHFRLNKAAATIGSLLSNTWLSIIVFAVAIDWCCFFSGLSNHEINEKFHDLIKNFHWSTLSDAFLLKIAGLIAVEFIIISLFLSVLAYGLCLMVIYWQRRSR